MNKLNEYLHDIVFFFHTHESLGIFLLAGTVSQIVKIYMYMRIQWNLSIVDNLGT